MEFVVDTSSRQEIIDITEEIDKLIFEYGVKEGVCNVFTKHATAAIIINENADPNILDDFIKGINKIVPEHDNYKHDKIDNNAASHIKAALLGPSETIPIKESKLMLGTWQSVMLVDLDGPKKRKVEITIMKSWG